MLCSIDLINMTFDLESHQVLTDNGTFLVTC